MYPLHCSSCVINDWTVVFLGSSGAGKTTTVNNALAKNGRLISNDMSFVSRFGGGFRIFPELWVKPAVKEPVKIDLFFSIRKSETVSINPIKALFKKVILSRAFLECAANRRLAVGEKTQLFDFIRDMSNAIPHYELELRNDSSFVDSVVSLLCGDLNPEEE
jgi:septin family protein